MNDKYIKMKNRKSKSKIIFTFCIVILIFTFLFLIWQSQNKEEPKSELDSFAQCIRDKGITMYGAEWCLYCQNEKRAFGSSFKYVPYVECPDKPRECIDAGVDGYPTWVLSDDTKLIGEQGLQKLSEASGCSFPQRQ